VKQPSKVSDTLSIHGLISTALSAIDNSSTNYTAGSIVPSKERSKKATSKDAQNPFIQQVDETITIRYPVQSAITKGVAFMSSHQALRFIQGKEGSAFENDYIREGNLIHHLFSLIYTMADIPNAVAQLVSEGSIAEQQSTQYITSITEHIKNSHVEHWFSDQYEVWNESSILSHIDKQLHRPDRVMRSKNQEEIIIIDYKTGAPAPEHQHQLNAYIQLLTEMGYQEVKGFIWYLREDKIRYFLTDLSMD
jgi:hypothetical protein